MNEKLLENAEFKPCPFCGEEVLKKKMCIEVNQCMMYIIVTLEYECECETFFKKNCIVSYGENIALKVAEKWNNRVSCNV